MQKSLYPWRCNNSFTLLRDGAQFFPALLAHFDQASEYILIEMYLIKSGLLSQQIFASLARAVQRGVTVHLLCDDYGTRDFTKADRQQLIQQGVHVCFYNRLHLREPFRYVPRDHRKIIIVDGETCFVGGLGFTDDFISHDDRPAWRETVVQIRGEVCRDWLQAFRDTWEHACGHRLTFPIPRCEQQLPAQSGRISLNPVVGRREIRRSIINRLRYAEKRIWLSTAYFVPSRKIRRLLRHAANRGIDVRLILPGSHTDLPPVRYAGRRFYARLLRNKVKIYEYQSRFLHQKVVLVDDWVSIGSANMDHWNSRWNLEANQEIDDQLFAQQVKDMLLDDMSQSVQLDYHAWQQRTRWGRFLEWFWGKIDQLLR